MQKLETKQISLFLRKPQKINEALKWQKMWPISLIDLAYLSNFK